MAEKTMTIKAIAMMDGSSVNSQEETPSAISTKEIKAYECKVLLLSSEPFPFKQKHINELQSLLPDTKILLADGEVFSWYGSRLLYAPDYFIQLRKDFEN